MDIHSLIAFVGNALVCGSLAVVLVTSWVWFIWSRVHAHRARAAGLDEVGTRPAGLVRAQDLLEHFERAPWYLCLLVLELFARLGRWVALREVSRTAIIAHAAGQPRSVCRPGGRTGPARAGVEVSGLRHRQHDRGQR